MKLDSSAELKHLMVDGGMTNGDMVMKVRGQRDQVCEDDSPGAAVVDVDEGAC